LSLEDAAYIKAYTAELRPMLEQVAAKAEGYTAAEVAEVA
jgi:D-aminopeptidase